RQHLENLRVPRRRLAPRRRRPKHFCTNLIKLPVAPFLWTLAAKLRPNVIKLAEPALPQLVLDVSPHHPRGIFRSQRERLPVVGLRPSPILPRIHFLGDDIRLFPPPAREEFRRLEDRRPNLLKVVRAKHLAHLRLDEVPHPRLRRQQISRSPNSLDHAVANSPFLVFPVPSSYLPSLVILSEAKDLCTPQTAPSANTHLENLVIPTRERSEARRNLLFRRLPLSADQLLSANCPPLLQICLFVPQIIPRITQDGLLIRRLQLPPEFSRRSHPQRSRFHHRFLRNQRPGRNNRPRPNPRAIQNNRSHPDQAAIFNHAPMQRHRMSDRHILPENHPVQFLHAMQYRAILNIRVRSDPDGMHIPAYHRVHPNAGMFPQHHVPDNLRRRIDITRSRHNRGHPLIRPNHSASLTEGKSRAAAED